MDPFYKVYGPSTSPYSSEEKKWICKHVDCWWCLKPNSVTQDTRCYVPIRVQDRIDGSFATFQEVEDKMTRKWGYFHSWQCALAYCQATLPHICFKVHEHARRNGFMGILAPSTDPRYTMSRFNPYVHTKNSMSYKELIPDPTFGMYMRRVPENEQCTIKFRDAHVVLEQTCDDKELTKEFPQCVQDSEQLVDQINSMESDNQDTSNFSGSAPSKTSNTSKTKPTKPTNSKPTNSKPTKPTKPTKRKLEPNTKKTKTKTTKRKEQTKINSLEKTVDKSQPRLDDFF